MRSGCQVPSRRKQSRHRRDPCTSANRAAGLVGIMRIEQVYPNKTWAGAMLRQPTFGVLNDFHTAPLDAPEALFAFRFGGEVIVEIEASIESRSESAAVKNHSTDEGCGLITLLFEQFRPSRVPWRERDTKVRYAVHAGQESSQDRSVRSVCDGTMRKRMRKAGAIRSQRVQRGSFDLLVSVATDVIRPQRVDGDQKNIRRRAPGRYRFVRE